MLRTIILIIAFLFSLSLVTMAYSQTAFDSLCPVGSQLAAHVNLQPNRDVRVVDHCGQHNAYIQGACCCNLKTGELSCPNNPVCVESLRSLKP